MTPRPVTIHVFCSVKGGVGKSTLAVACAALAASGPRSCVVLDADLTGTSLADGLNLLAPRLPGPEGGPAPGAPLDGPPAYHDLSQTRLLRRRRWLDPEQAHLPFFNDALFSGGASQEPGEERPIGDMLWRHQRDNGVRYLPSSATRADVTAALGWLYRVDEPLAWIRRVAWLIEELLAQVPELRHIVLDLPPGMVGFSHEVMLLLSELAAARPLPAGYPPLSREALRWRVNPFLVTSQDRNDLFTALEYFVEISQHLTPLVPLVNRRTLAASAIAGWIREYFVELPWLAEGIRYLDPMHQSLGRIFVEGDLELLGDEARTLRTVLRLDEDP